MAASHATQLARRAGGTLASLMLVAGLALTVAPAANANGYPRCTPDKFTGGSVSVTPLGVATISGDVTVPASTQCDGQLVIAAGTTATLHLGGNLTVYALDEASTLDNKGTLTVTGSGTLELAGAKSVGIDNSGALTMSGGTVTASGGEVGGGSIENSGVLTISGGTITANGISGSNGVYNNGTVTVTGSGTLTATGDENVGNVGDGIFNDGSLTISGGTVTANGSSSNTYSGGNGINNHGTMAVVGGSLTATGGNGASDRNGGNGILNYATLATTVMPTLIPGTGSADGSPLVNSAKIVMPAAPGVGFAANNAQATIDANNDTVMPQVLYFFAAAPALGLRSPTHALRTPLLQIPAPPGPTVGNLLDALGAVSANWPKASSNFTFTGWHSASDSSGAQYRSGDTTFISSLGTPTFYAHWSSKEQSSQPPQSSPTQTEATTTTTASTSAASTAAATTATTKSTPHTTSAFTANNNVAEPYTFTSSATPPAPPLPTTSSANDGSHSQLGLSHSSIQQSGDFTATATGFKPGSVVDFYLWSTPIYLGSAVADIHGVAVLHVALTPAYVGEHHVQVVGIGLQGQPRNLAQAITITQPPALAETGLGAAWLLGPALVLLLLGVSLVRVGRRYPARLH